MSLEFHRKLPIPKDVKEQYPLSEKVIRQKEQRDREIRDIFSGKDGRFVLIVGPCSADYEDSVMEYVYRLARLQERVKDKVLLIPRIFTNKPRTNGSGYKGMIHQPNPEGKPDLLAGILSIRSLHARVINETGLTSADEMLYPDNTRYLSDLVSYFSVGARSVEDQQHRLVSSGVCVPVGMKNPPSGDLSAMLNAVYAAQHSHTFIYRGWEVTSSGNPLAHAVLRGATDQGGAFCPNYRTEDLRKLNELYHGMDLQNICCIVDTNHCNSGKNHKQQIRIAHEVLQSRSESTELKTMVKGLMIESYLEEGRQEIGEKCFGKSITDPCLGWKDTEELIELIADRV